MPDDHVKSQNPLKESPCWFTLMREPGLHLGVLSFLVAVLLGMVAFDFFNSSFEEQAATELAEIRKFRNELAHDHRIETIVNTQSHSALATLSLAQKALWIDNNYEQAIGYADRAEHAISMANAVVPKDQRDSFDSINMVQKSIWTVRGYAACLKSDHGLLKTSGLRLVSMDENDAEGCLFLGLESMHLASQHSSENELTEARNRLQKCLLINRRGHESQVFLAILELDSKNLTRAIDLAVSYRVAFPDSADDIHRLGDRPRLFVKLAKGVEVLSSYLKDPKGEHQFPDVNCGDRVSSLNKIEGEILVGFLQRLQLRVQNVCVVSDQAVIHGEDVICPANTYVKTLIRAIERASACEPDRIIHVEPLSVPVRPKARPAPEDPFSPANAPAPPAVAPAPSAVPTEIF